MSLSYNVIWGGQSLENWDSNKMYDPSQIHPNLKINEGEVKILVDVIIRTSSSNVKEVLGLYLVV